VNPKVIAIDGPGGAGKSTIAKLLAKRLGILYIDSGAMYRAVTWKALSSSVDFKNTKELVKIARGCKLKFSWDQSKKNLNTFLDGKNVSKEIRSKEVDGNVSAVAKVPGVRKILVAQQRQMGKMGGVVMDGRDIGSVVFPKADFKFYLDASIKERATRRYKEVLAKGKKTKLSEIERELNKRDKIDSQRDASPLKKAADAISIDSTRLSIEQVVDKMLKLILDLGQRPRPQQIGRCPFD